jgi:Fe-S cluster assembly iron-binding protein IscA
VVHWKSDDSYHHTTTDGGTWPDNKCDSVTSGEHTNIVLALQFTAPGTYVVTGNLTTSAFTAISISSMVSGPVILDLKGHTITGAGESYNSNAVNISGLSTNAYPITVQNGTITGFAYGVSTGNNNGSELVAIKLSNLAISAAGVSVPTTAGFYIDFTANSIISDCAISNSSYGIIDFGSSGGNTYTNLSFTKVSNPLSIVIPSNINTTQVLAHCQFGTSTN